MFENIDVRKVANGYIVSVTTEDGETHEYVFETFRKSQGFRKRLIHTDK